MNRLGIGIGTTVLCSGLAGAGIDGIGHYTRELLERLSLDPALDLVPFAFGAGALSPGGPTPLTLPRFSLASLPSLLLGQSCWGSQKLRSRVDLIHATDHLIPRVKGVPVLATIMDAIPLAHPEWVNYRFKTITNAIWRKSAHFADHIITISEHSKSDLVHYFGLPAQRISVTPLGVDSRWFVKPSPQQLHDIRERYRLPETFLLFMGTLQPRKNLARIIDAHRTLPITTRQAYPLLITGRCGWQCDGVMERLRGDDAQLRWLKYVPGEDLPVILHCAGALVFASLHEGFGLPVLEAFAAQVPVITSNSTALPEVAGDAALLVDPCDGENIAWAMQKIVEDTALAAQLRQAGLKRAREFNWDKTAQATSTIYRQLGARQ